MLQLSDLPEAAPAVTSWQGHAEHSVIAAVQWLKLGIETLGAVIIAIGVLAAAGLFVKALLARKTADFNAIRLTLARYLALALEFQLGADILSTAIAPSWEQIGKLGAIAVIRTALNYFLTKEIEMEQKHSDAAQNMDERL